MKFSTTIIKSSLLFSVTDLIYTLCQVNPSDAGIYDRVVVQDLIKTIAQTNQLDSEKMREFKVVVLTGFYKNRD